MGNQLDRKRIWDNATGGSKGVAARRSRINKRWDKKEKVIRKLRQNAVFHPTKGDKAAKLIRKLQSGSLAERYARNQMGRHTNYMM